MKNMSNLDVDHDFFSGKRSGEVVILRFKDRPLLSVTDIDAKEVLFGYLDQVASHHDIKVVLIMGAPVKMEYENYIEFYRKIMRSGLYHNYTERFLNAVSQFVLKLAGFNKIVVHADSGKIILLFMNISLACDYRIITDNTVFQNPNIELNIVPKGGGVFFLSKMLGSAKASEILLSGEDITALEALELGIVDKVVPVKEFGETAIKVAQTYAEKPANYLSGIKRLLNYDIKTLEGCLECENELLRRAIRSLAFKKMEIFHGAT